MDRLGCGFEVKFADGAENGTFSGYGAVFGNVDSYGDVLNKGAFKDTLREWKKQKDLPAMLLQHGGFMADDMTPIGIWTDMEEDDYGLKVEGKLAETTRGKDIYALLKMTPRPAIKGLSIGYRAKEYIVGTKPTEPRRMLKKVDLYEVSLVTMAANTLAKVDAVKNGMPTERQFEDWLVRDAGFSRSTAKAIISSGFKSVQAVRDAGGSGSLIETINRATQALRA